MPQTARASRNDNKNNNDDDGRKRCQREAVISRADKRERQGTFHQPEVALRETTATNDDDDGEKMPKRRE